MQSRQDGFSLVDTMVSLAVFGILSAMALIQVGQSVPAMRADGAMRVVMGQLNQARELAISQRRYMQVRFTAPNQMQIIRTNVNTTGTVIGTTVLSTVFFEGAVTFNKFASIPDTPDAFGMPSAINFGTATTLQFTTEGLFVDQTGNPLNGTVVVASPNIVNSSRAVTIFGSTGRVRAFRWDGRSWVRV
jgi:type II secretory pathway pseudopilin PulG